ncbi:cytokine-dependent hematopoietic cell linker-like [Bufo bufo]|uniref:cytokine-dependent hematopoietic cell linker-like n=1 Tax=Bufo bufo TaxID=8384 RepID=UPI001ABDAEC9|nr:cytokine-dependent hematopoietic cell linker-like [Bufo bufo]
MHKSDQWQVQQETAKEGPTDDYDEESYEFIDGGEAHFSTMHFSQYKGTSEYADKRCFQTEINDQPSNNLQLSPAVHHVSRSTFAARPQAQRHHFKESRSIRDQRMLSVTNFKDTTPSQRFMPINSCEQNSVRSSSKTKDKKSQPSKGPAVNRSLKPQHFCQVNESPSSPLETHKGRGIKKELNLSIQPHAMPYKLSTEKKTESTASRRFNLQSQCNDKSRGSSLTQNHHMIRTPPWKPESDCTAAGARTHTGIKQMQQRPHPVTVPKVLAAKQKIEARSNQCPGIQKYKDSQEDLSLAEKLQQQLQSFNDKTPSMLPGRITWYLNECDRCKAEHFLYEENKDGAFLVRDNSHRTFNEPYVLSIYYKKKVYHIKIRYLEETQQYALGTGRRGNYKFSSVEDIIEFHRSLPLLLVNGKANQFQGLQCFLTHPPIMTGRRSPQTL